MSKSSGNIIAISELTKILPPEVVRYFTLRYPASKQLFFDQTHGVTKLIDDYAQLLAKADRTEEERQLLEICQVGSATIVSRIPFSHLVTSYQAALKEPEKTLDVLSRTEYKSAVEQEREVIKKELSFIDGWLNRWAPEDSKFELLEKADSSQFSQEEKDFLANLSQKIAQAPTDADGEWFHKAVYEIQTATKAEPKDLFSALYRALIGKEQGPRAGWFLSILPRDWLIRRLRIDN